MMKGKKCGSAWQFNGAFKGSFKGLNQAKRLQESQNRDFVKRTEAEGWYAQKEKRRQKAIHAMKLNEGRRKRQLSGNGAKVSLVKTEYQASSIVKVEINHIHERHIYYDGPKFSAEEKKRREQLRQSKHARIVAHIKETEKQKAAVGENLCLNNNAITAIDSNCNGRLTSASCMQIHDLFVGFYETCHMQLHRRDTMYYLVANTKGFVSCSTYHELSGELVHEQQVQQSSPQLAIMTATPECVAPTPTIHRNIKYRIRHNQRQAKPDVARPFEGKNFLKPGIHNGVRSIRYLANGLHKTTANSTKHNKESKTVLYNIEELKKMNPRLNF